MAPRRSAGILLFRRTFDGTADATAGGMAGGMAGGIEVLLGHSGGPFWTGKDVGAWSIPKGEYLDDEEPIAAARREFTEELGLPVPPGELVPLGEITQKNGKVVTAWALEADLDPDSISPGTFTMQWPRGSVHGSLGKRRSGRQQEFPEIDRVEWFSPADAAVRMVAGQQAFLDRLG